MEATDIELVWPVRLRALLAKSPIVTDVNIEMAGQSRGGRTDAVVTFKVAGEAHCLLVDQRSVGTPRQVESVVKQLARAQFANLMPTRMMLIAPFVSPSARAALEKLDMGWLDLAGNARLSFPRMFMHVDVTDSDPTMTKRDLRTLFSPKTARLMKYLLTTQDPAHTGRQLAQMLQVSESLISKARQTLLAQQWAEGVSGGWLRLTDPDAVLNAWRDYGHHAPEVVFKGFSTLQGAQMESVMQAVFKEIHEHPGVQGGGGENSPGAMPKLALASHSVARRMAPYLRHSGEYLYANAHGLSILGRHLKAVPVTSGENITVYKPRDPGLWLDLQPLGTLRCTDRVQTYLDLLASGERGREAAEHWRHVMLLNAEQL